MEHFSNLIPRLEFFLKYNGALKKLRMILGRNDILHHSNRLLASLNSKFDELKQFH